MAVVIGSPTKIENLSNYSKIINGSIKYGFEGRLNLTFADDYGIFGLPVNIVGNETTDELRNFSIGIEQNYTEILVKNTRNPFIQEIIPVNVY